MPTYTSRIAYIVDIGQLILCCVTESTQTILFTFNSGKCHTETMLTSDHTDITASNNHSR